MGYIKIYQSGNTTEVYEYEKNCFPHAQHRRKTPHGTRYPRHARRTEASVRRARRSFTRLVRANLIGTRMPLLLTLSMYQVLPYPASVRIFTDFATKLRRLHGETFRYIAVPEFQKRGATHWHVLLWGLPIETGCVGYFINKPRKQFFCTSWQEGRCECATRNLARLWLRGFSDAIQTDGHDKLATYLAKYMQKAMHDQRLVGKKAYYASRNCVRPLSAGANSLDQYLSDIVIPSELVNQREFSTLWLGKCNYKIYLKKSS